MLDALIFKKTPRWAQLLYSDCLWQMPDSDNTLYLTFDDGPQEGITDFVLDTLRMYQAKATFFCIGKNIEQQPLLFQQIIAEGHRVGNHTYNHLNGWNTPLEDYNADVQKCAEVLQSSGISEANTLMRPPYGKLTISQYKALKEKYKIVMWDVLSLDYSPTIQAEKVLDTVCQYAGPGSIIVMHDSRKAEAKVRYALPRILQYYSEKGFRFAAL